MSKKLWLLGAAALLTLVCAAILYAFLIEPLPPEAELPQGSGLGDAVESLLAYRLRFACGHYYSHSPQDGAAGLLRYFDLTEGDIVWEDVAISTSATGAMRQGSVAGLCPACKPQYFAGVKDGYVAIYYGSPRQDAPLKQLTAVRLELLPKDFQASLRRGIPIRDDYALMLFLEGIEY
ncbi:MAG: hypothetical protein DDT20_00192 [Firmicutes bacterium]|nr:hypothetical protein [Bacillota bacterium]